MNVRSYLNRLETYKVTYHKQFLKGWLIEAENVKIVNDCDFNKLWKIREECIKQLSK